MTARSSVAACLSAVVGMAFAAGAAVVSAAPASGDSGTWVQQFQRSGPDAVCAAPADETPWQSTFTGQREWTASWAQWPNAGAGGWVCQRSVIWAQMTVSNCQYLFTSGTPRYAQFGGSWWVSESAPTYGDAACSDPDGFSLGDAVVLASSASQAQERCAAVQTGFTAGDEAVLPGNPAVWTCNRFA